MKGNNSENVQAFSLTVIFAQQPIWCFEHTTSEADRSSTLPFDHQTKSFKPVPDAWQCKPAYDLLMIATMRQLHCVTVTPVNLLMN